MTLTAEKIEAISPYSVGTVRSETVMLATDFKWFLTLATNRLTREAPASLDSDTYELLQAYLVCHFKSIHKIGADGDLSSESIGGYSYSRRSDVVAGSTGYEQRYLEALKAYGRKQPSQQGTRTDAILPIEFSLDDNDIDGSDDGVVIFDGEI